MGMSRTPTQRRQDAALSTYGGPGEAGSGWVAFAAIMIGLVGTVNVIYGIAAIDNASFFVNETRYIIHSLNVYGWVTLIVGAVQIVAAALIFGQNAFGRWIGIITAGLNVLVQMTWLGTAPFAAIAFMALDVMIIYALVVHGKARAAL